LRKNAAAYVLLLVLVTLPLSLGWMLEIVARPNRPSAPASITFDLPVIDTSIGGGATPPKVTLRATLLLHSRTQVGLVEQRLPKLVDAIITRLHGLPPADPERRQALAGLRDELHDRIDEVLAPEKIDDLLLKEVTIR
jgi:flagellar basal body-associated protein FliL